VIAVVVELSEIVGVHRGSGAQISPGHQQSGKTTRSWFARRLLCLAAALTALSVFLYQSATLCSASPSTCRFFTGLSADSFPSILWWGRDLVGLGRCGKLHG